MFNLKKSYYNDEYVIIEFRHELINSDGKMIMDETQILFHRIYIYKIKELLNSKEPIDFQKSKPFLRIDLPLSMNGFLMKLFNLKNNTIIIKNKFNSNYIYIDLNKYQLELIKDKQIPSTINAEHSNSAINNSTPTVVSTIHSATNNTKKPNCKIYFSKIIFGSLIILCSFIAYLKYCGVNFSFPLIRNLFSQT